MAVNFLAYVNIGRGTAQQISNAIIQALENNLQLTRQTIFTKLVGFGSDGGCKSGGGTQLMRELTTTLVHAALHGSPAGTGVQGNYRSKHLHGHPSQSYFFQFKIFTSAMCFS